MDPPFHSQNPAISSFVSGKAPSITVRFSLKNLTRSLRGRMKPLAGEQHAGFHQLFIELPISARSLSPSMTPAASDSCRLPY